MWKELLAFISGSTIIIAAVAWLTKSIITHFLSKDVENFKIKIKAETDRNIEELKSALKMTALEHEVRFRRLHEKRAEVIAEIYKKMIDAHFATSSFVARGEYENEPNKKEKFKILEEKISEFLEYYGKFKIYLNTDLCEGIEKFAQELRGPALTLNMFINNPDEGTLGKIKQESWTEAWIKVNDTIVPQARRELEQEFRKLLGVVDSGNTNNLKM